MNQQLYINVMGWTKKECIEYLECAEWTKDLDLKLKSLSRKSARDVREYTARFVANHE